MIKKFNMLFENNEETTKEIGTDRVPEKEVAKQEEPKKEEPKQDVAEKETIIEESVQKYKDFLIEVLALGLNLLCIFFAACFTLIIF